MKTPRTPEIDSQTSFERIIAISASLGSAGIEHEVVNNDLDEPLAIYVPGIMGSQRAREYAQLAMFNRDGIHVHHRRDVLNDMERLRWNSSSPEGDLLYATQGMTVKEREDYKRYAHPSVRQLNIAKLFPISPAGRLSMFGYPLAVGQLIDRVVEGVSTVKGYRVRRITPTLTEELGGGDSFPHFDYPEVGDILAQKEGEGVTPNIHLTIKGTGVVRVGQVRHYEWVTTLRDGIREAQKAGMTSADINNNFTSDWIRKGADERVPESLKHGVAYLEEALSHATPFVELHEGDAFIFDGCQQGSCLPQVHDFRTLRVSDDPEENRRMFAVTRPELVRI